MTVHKRKLAQRSALALLMAGSLVTVSGCAAESSDGAAPELDLETPTTLTVQSQTSQEGLFEYIASAFEEKYPNVTVELQVVSQEAKVGSNLAVLGSSNPPDVGMIPINSEVYTQLTAAEALVDIDDVWQQAELYDRYSEGVSTWLTAAGAPFTVAFSSVIYNVVWYNPDLFAEVGIEAPANNRLESVDQLIEISNALTDAGYGPFQIGGNSGYMASWMVDALLPSAATSDQMANFNSAFDPAIDITANYTDAPFVSTIEALERMAVEGVFQQGFLGQDAPTSLAPFLGGTAGMALGGNFTTADFVSNEIGFEPSWFLLPPVEPGGTVVQSLYFGDAMGIPAKSDNIAWAKEFLVFVMSDEMQLEAIVNESGLLPSVNSLPDDALSALPASVQELVQDINANGGAPGWTSTVPGAFAQQFIDPLLQRMYGGELTPAEIAEQQQAKLLEWREDAGS